jgi:hypothetical protein
MPFRQLDSAFLHQEFKQLISFSDIKVIGALGLFDPALIHGQQFFPPHDLSSSHFLVIVPFDRPFPGTDSRYRLRRAVCRTWRLS